MVREHYLHPVLVGMAMESSHIFHNFADEIGGDAGFRQTGSVRQCAPEILRRSIESRPRLARGSHGDCTEHRAPMSNLVLGNLAKDQANLASHVLAAARQAHDRSDVLVRRHASVLGCGD